jgi:serine/threonine protein kinase
MAPEQADPQRLGAPDVLTDVYGLGGMLFEILYDDPPNGRQGASVIEILAVLASRKGPPRRGTLGTRAARCRKLARKLEPVGLRALEYDRTARQASVAALVNEVEQCAWGWRG